MSTPGSANQVSLDATNDSTSGTLIDLDSPTTVQTPDTAIPDPHESMSTKSEQDHIEDDSKSGDGDKDETGSHATTEDDDEELDNENENGSHHDDNDTNSANDHFSDCGSNSTAMYEHESFETYQLKVAQLCRDLKYGELQKIDRMHGGGYNRVIGLQGSETPAPDLVLRVPRFLDLDQAHEITDQVAVLSYLSQYDFLHVPEVVGYDTTENNALSSIFSLQRRIHGVPIEEVFYDLPLAEKLQITTLVAELLLKMETVRFEQPGRLRANGTLPPKSNETPPSVKDVKIGGFRLDPMEDMPEAERQPLCNLLVNLFSILKKKGPTVEECDKLIEITKEMETAGLMRNTDTENVLWHWDLSASNILIRQTADEKSKTVETKPTKGPSRHAVEIKVENSDPNAPKHTIQVQVEDASGKKCNHKIEVAIEDHTGKKYKHTVQITTDDDAAAAEPESAPSQTPPTSTQGKWTISGIIDWDDVLSVPLVLARKPPSWLWFSELTRTLQWTGNRDTPPERDLTEDELTIKAHYDQIMARKSPIYIDDTYHRGIWLRKLARFAIYGFTSNEDWKKFWAFEKDWAGYYNSLSIHKSD
ncbi:hypothetical protein G7Y89_g15110 [Cudoniella acicularis]|uniref:Aminoglycoside phosphotransferase domain-containing protein n=1 Tax=Cudoniella acicularis TaxID=354080 RepID=A0A8H4VR55_9HELO|nr:hypothetical protein G7Y89_g15110 [Cudoniella acicularis]